MLLNAASSAAPSGLIMLYFLWYLLKYCKRTESTQTLNYCVSAQTDTGLDQSRNPMAQTFLLKHTGLLTGRTGHGAIASLVQGRLGTVCWWHPIAGNVNCECRDFPFVTLSCQCTHKVGSRATCQCLPTVGPTTSFTSRQALPPQVVCRHC